MARVQTVPRASVWGVEFFVDLQLKTRLAQALIDSESAKPYISAVSCQAAIFFLRLVTIPNTPRPERNIAQAAGSGVTTLNPHSTPSYTVSASVEKSVVVIHASPSQLALASRFGLS